MDADGSVDVVKKALASLPHTEVQLTTVRYADCCAIKDFARVSRSQWDALLHSTA